MIGRRQFIFSCATAFTPSLLNRRSLAEHNSDIINRMEGSIGAAVRFLTTRQGQDGAWRSEIYGPFKDGPSLTSLIAATLAPLHHRADCHNAWLQAVQYLATLAPYETARGHHAEMTYPVYTAAGAVIALANQPEFGAARNNWLSYLRSLQLSDAHGWQPSDTSYGGWSYAATGLQPINGLPATPLAVPNLSATVFALDALRTAGVCESDSAIRQALTFVKRCQNWSDDPNQRDPHFDDGGFFFLIDDPQRNKAGEVGHDATGQLRFASYGSATADGLRALTACGLQPDSPRRIAAQNWLLQNFSATKHPGHYSSAREHLRPTLYYYFCYSAARALAKHDGAAGKRSNLAEALLARQRPDGSWFNPAVDVREDDPLVATPLAIQALMACAEQ